MLPSISFSFSLVLPLTPTVAAIGRNRRPSFDKTGIREDVGNIVHDLLVGFEFSKGFENDDVAIWTQTERFKDIKHGKTVVGRGVCYWQNKIRRRGWNWWQECRGGLKARMRGVS